MARVHPLKRVFDRHARSYVENLAPASAGRLEAVHDCRVASRRLREILPMCEAGLTLPAASKTRRRLRRVGRTLGSVRELDVALALLDELAARQPSGAAILDQVRAYLTDLRHRRRADMRNRLDALKLSKIESDLGEVARILRKAGDSNAWAQALALRIARRIQQVRSTVTRAGAMYISDRVHAVRIATKKLRYALEFATASGAAPMKRVVVQLKAIQDTLGRLQDFEVLGRIIQQIPAETLPQPAAELETLRAGVERECRRVHSRYVAKRKTLLASCDLGVAAAVRIWRERGGDAARGRALKMSLVPTAASRREA